MFNGALSMTSFITKKVRVCLTPGNAIIWYQTVLAFLAQHVLGEPWQRPDLL